MYSDGGDAVADGYSDTGDGVAGGDAFAGGDDAVDDIADWCWLVIMVDDEIWTL